MVWTCPRCQQELGELNGYCLYCYHSDDTKTKIYNPDKYFVREIRIRHIEEDVMSMMSKIIIGEPNGTEKQGLTGEELLKAIEADERMTPQEKLHAKFFYHESILVKDMSTLELRAHIEELSKIAFEARSRHGAATAEEQKRKKISGVPSGFERSLNTDETATNAINKIKERKQRLSKEEKLAEGMKKLGISVEESENLLSSSKILSHLKDKKDQKARDIMLGKETRSPLSSENGFVISKRPEDLKQEDVVKKPFNPFAKKSE